MAVQTMYVNMYDKKEGMIVNCPICKGEIYNSTMYDELCESCKRLLLWIS